MNGEADPSLAEGESPGSLEPSSVDLLAAALRAERADLDLYERVVLGALSEALPQGVVEVTRVRSVADRLAGRPGRVQAIAVELGEHRLELAGGHRGLVATVTRKVRGVSISRKEVTIEEWTKLLAEHLALVAARDATARAVLERLLRASELP
jgi:hypothetical protein